MASYVTAPSRMPALAEFSAEQIWEAMEPKAGPGDDHEEQGDLKIAEWAVSMQNPAVRSPTKDFRATRVAMPFRL